MTISLQVLLKDSAYKLSQFKPAHINALQAAITLKDVAKKPTSTWRDTAPEFKGPQLPVSGVRF